MADDDDLNEDEFRLTTNERLKQSKKKRAQQLRKYAQHEKQLEKEYGKKSKKLENAIERKNDKKIQFPGNVTLLEAAARDDKDEGKVLRVRRNPMIVPWLITSTQYLYCCNRSRIAYCVARCIQLNRFYCR